MLMQTISLPQLLDEQQQQARAFDLSLAKTKYNYMCSYLPGVPLSADLPKGEEFTPDYLLKVLEVVKPITINFKNAVFKYVKKELADDLCLSEFQNIEKALAEFDTDHGLKKIEDFMHFFKTLKSLPKAFANLKNLPKDLEKIFLSIDKTIKELEAEGPTAFLKSTMYNILSTEVGRNYLLPECEADYEALFTELPKPATLTIPSKDWMLKGDPWTQDWFFGFLQIGGFNTTQIKRVQMTQGDNKHAITIDALRSKMPLDNTLFQQATGQDEVSLEDAVEKNLIYCVDYEAFVGAKTDKIHGLQRYLSAPIAIFYWNATPPKGYPTGGALQPVAIQLGQTFDAESTPIFTPNDCNKNNDDGLFKWKIAKYIVNVCCAIQHESVAHLGNCHLTLDPIIVAAHRTLSADHPIMKLFAPHFKFTININNDALHSLIIPGGTVATNVGPAIASTLDLVAKAHHAWRFDDNNPENIFKLYGVDLLPDFPFRDDTQALWHVIKKFVSGYLNTYYTSPQLLAEDFELQNWIKELVSEHGAAVKGLNGLVTQNDAPAIDSLDYLIQVVSQIIYIAGPLHASVNYTQFPLMSFTPSVAGAIYHDMPTKSESLASESDCLKWYPPIDIAMYTSSFEYLLSGVQYDTFGHYDNDPRNPYFNNESINDLVKELQYDLAVIEKTIREKNKQRPMPYPYQLPSLIPNSISI